MTLKELGYQYLEEEKKLRARLKELQAIAAQGDDRILRRRMYYLATEAAQCRKTGEYLLHYYGEDENA